MACILRLAIRPVRAAFCGVMLCGWAGAQALRQNAPERPRLAVRHAFLFTMADVQKTPFSGCFTVARNGRIVTVAPDDPPVCRNADEVLDAQGMWVMPGFVSAHSHLWQSAYRGLAADKTLLGWIDALYGKAVTRATPEDLYWFTLNGALDHLRHGITTVYNFNYGGHSRGEETPNDRESFSEQELRAEIDSGIRFVHGWEPGRANERYTPTVAADQLRLFYHFAGTLDRDAPGRLLSVSLNGGTAFAGTYAQAVLEAALMREFPEVGNQSHYLEQPETQAAGRETVWPWFVRSGLLTRRMVFGHFIHTDAAILAATGAAGAAMSWNPLSNGRLASGVADIPAYLKAGVRVGMGVDGEASADLADPFENMRTGLYAIRDKYEDAGAMSPYEVLRLHTRGSADVLGAADRVGSLEPGKMADFLVISPHSFGEVFDPYATLVFVTGQNDVERVYAGGELRVLHGKLIARDAARVQDEVRRRVAARVVR